jgi:hypothetical protein
MSRFFPITLSCPSCKEPVKFSANSSVNADRRPDLRDEIIAGTFQRETCLKCSTSFRLDPELTYLDVGRGQWIGVYPASKLNDWQALETSSREAFDLAYGPRASEGAQEIGRDLKPRVVFGWPAFREKLVARELGLDDVTLELLKIAMLRGLDEPLPLSGANEVRLAEFDPETSELVVAILSLQTGGLVEELRVPRELYDEIAADQEGWRELRQELSEGYFVDMSRLMIADPAAKA